MFVAVFIFHKAAWRLFGVLTIYVFTTTCTPKTGTYETPKALTRTCTVVKTEHFELLDANNMASCEMTDVHHCAM